MRNKFYTMVLGLVAWVVVGVPLKAQVPDSLLPNKEYQGIPLTPAQVTQAQELRKNATKEDGGGSTWWKNAFRTMLTSEQQKILDRNIQVVRLWNKADGAGQHRAAILMGSNPTDEQMAAIEKILVKEREEIQAFRKSVGLIPDEPISAEAERKAAKFKLELLAKNCDTLYALLTPEQQKVAARKWKELKVTLESAAQSS